MWVIRLPEVTQALLHDRRCAALARAPFAGAREKRRSAESVPFGVGWRVNCAGCWLRRDAGNHLAMASLDGTHVDDLPGVLVRVFSTDGEDLGTARLPFPIVVGDVTLLARGPLLRVIDVLEAATGQPHAIVLSPCVCG